MAITTLSFRLDQLRDDGLIATHFEGKTGIYIWSIFPNYNSVDRLMPLLSNMSTNRIIAGQDEFSDRNVTVRISADTGAVTNERWIHYGDQNRGNGSNSLLAHVGRFLAPPIYIGKSFKNIDSRLKAHRSALTSVFESLEYGVIDEDSEARTFAERLRSTYEGLEEHLNLEADDFGVHVFLIEDARITNDDLEKIENLYIKALWPVGNKKVIT